MAYMGPNPTDVNQTIAEVGIARAIGSHHVASLLFTYRCTIACGHCLFACSPTLPDVCCELDEAVDWLGQLLSTNRVVHIAGGEAMIAWDRLLAVCRAASAAGVMPHFIESNASWATSDVLVRERLTLLRDLGLRGMLYSADPYHQAFVPPERRLRAYTIAVEVFGAQNVIAADLTLPQLEELREIGRDEQRLADYTRSHPPNLVGRAGDSLAAYFPDRPLDELAGDRLWHGEHSQRHCQIEFDPRRMWEIHIDPYGNLQTCCGIVLGNLRRRSLADLMGNGFDDSAVLRAVRDDGPFAMLALAESHGYQRRPGYKQKCHLCWEVRRHLRTYYPEQLGPDEVYGEPSSTPPSSR